MLMPSVSRTARILAAAMALAALLAGCGKQESTPATAGQAAPVAATPETLTVKIGHAAPLTGPANSASSAITLPMTMPPSRRSSRSPAEIVRTTNMSTRGSRLMSWEVVAMTG